MTVCGTGRTNASMVNEGVAGQVPYSDDGKAALGGFVPPGVHNPRSASAASAPGTGINELVVFTRVSANPLPEESASVVPPNASFMRQYATGEDAKTAAAYGAMPLSIAAFKLTKLPSSSACVSGAPLPARVTIDTILSPPSQQSVQPPAQRSGTYRKSPVPRTRRCWACRYTRRSLRHHSQPEAVTQSAPAWQQVPHLRIC